MVAWWGSAVCFAAPLLKVSDVTQADSAAAAALAEERQWLALIHARTGSPEIDDPSFLLSAGQYSAQAELALTVSALATDPAVVCRFPARYLWLSRYIALPANALAACPEWLEFRERAPAAGIDLAFVSEVATQPTSILGHSLIILHGRDAQGRELQHAISFYTDAATWNIPKLVVETTLLGKRGAFSLSPFGEQIHRYVDIEQRSIWRYPILLDESQLELLQAHLIELKHTSLVYFFQKFNCADLNYEIAAVGAPSLPVDRGLMTPARAVRLVESAGLAGSPELIASDTWLIRMATPSLGVRSARRIDDVIEGDTPIGQALPEQADQRYFWLKTADAYNRRALAEGRVGTDRFQRNETALQASLASGSGGRQLQAHETSGPIGAPADSQWSVDAGADAGRGQLRANLLPVSHRLIDDNGHRLGESALAVLDAGLRLEVDPAKLVVDHLRLVDTTSLIPVDALLGGWSGHFELGYRPVRTRELEATQRFLVAGALGQTWRLHPDVDFYLLGGGGISATGSGPYFWPQLEGGMIIREVGNLKSLIRYRWIGDEADDGGHRQELLLDQAWYMSPRFGLLFQAGAMRGNGEASTLFAVGLRQHF